MTSQAGKAERFRALHGQSGLFVMPNPFDGGSARALEKLGYPALATSSGAAAGTYGKRDGHITREQALAHVKLIADATSLPVSADLENGFGAEPASCAETIHLAAAAGAVGGSIEDYTGDPAKGIFELDLAVQRIEAAVAAARALPFPFTLTGRCENFLRNKPNLDDTIKRLQAYEAAGADCLFAPCLPDLESVKRVAGALKKPLNFMAGIPGKSWDTQQLAAAGVRRVSFGSSLYDVALKSVTDAAAPTLKDGRFGWL